MRGDLSNNMVSVKIEGGSKRAISLHEKGFYGKIECNFLQLSLIEGFYLLEKGRLNIFKENKPCDEDYIMELLKNQGLYARYIVFRDLRDRGYIIKTGFKYGSDFRLYDRGRNPGEGHSDYLVKIVFKDHCIDVLDFSSYVRVANGVNKKLLLAVVDEDFDITYYNVEWIRP